MDSGSNQHVTTMLVAFAFGMFMLGALFATFCVVVNIEKTRVTEEHENRKEAEHRVLAPTAKR